MATQLRMYLGTLGMYLGNSKQKWWGSRCLGIFEGILKKNKLNIEKN